MADDVTLPGTGAVVATDDVGGRQFQVIKLDVGGNGASTPVSGAVPVSGPLTDTELRATAVPVSGPLTDGQLRATAVPVSGPLTDAQLRATAVPVSGTVTASGPLTDAQLRASAVPVSAASLPLPTGAATETTLAAIAAAVKAEDSAASSGDMGVPMLAMRFASDAPTTSDDGDYALLKLDEEGRLKVASKPASYAATTGNITANGQTVFVNCERFSNVMAHCTGTFSTVNCIFEGSLNSTNGTDGNWFTVQAIRSNANTIETTTGNLSAAPAYAWELSVNALKYFRIRATAFTSGTQVWTFVPGTYATEPIPGVQTHGISGTVTCANSAGTNLIGDVGVQVRANATGAASIHHIVSAGSTNVVQIKATAGRVYGYCLSNTNAAWRYVKLHNVASATAGSGVVMTIGIPPNGKAECALPQGIGFATAISRSIVTGAADTDATAVGANDVLGDIFFA